MAGKLRRYSHLTKLRQLFMPRIVFANFRDTFKILGGLLQSVWIIFRFRPDVLFAKGGYVCLPVGMAAKLLGVPIVIHDSDTRPGLTNRVLGRWAAAIATGSPLENYRYPKRISRYVGVPIATAFHPYSDTEQRAAKRLLGFDENRPLVVATGGGLGAASINQAVLHAASEIISEHIQMYHVTGQKHFDNIVSRATQSNAYRIVPFVYEGMADILGAADIIISRASATFIQEIAGLKKAAILIPSRALGDQIGNARVYDAAAAAIVLSDDQLEDAGVLTQTIKELLANDSHRLGLATRLHAFAKPNAARDVASMIVEVACQKKRRSAH